MRVFIAGIDGYLGWSLAQYLTKRGHEVGGADLYLRREWVAEMGAQSATPIVDMDERLKAFQENFNTELWFKKGDFMDYDFVLDCFREFNRTPNNHAIHTARIGGQECQIIKLNRESANLKIGIIAEAEEIDQIRAR